VSTCTPVEAPGIKRARIAAGAVYSAAQVGGALADYFRVANLQALSELARAWIAGTAEAVGEVANPDR